MRSQKFLHLSFISQFEYSSMCCLNIVFILLKNIELDSICWSRGDFYAILVCINKYDFITRALKSLLYLIEEDPEMSLLLSQ